ncbi:hypothetical protein B0H10DRAFT_2183874, partial [Mycena sp. CBHHK59/15]
MRGHAPKMERSGQTRREEHRLHLRYHFETGRLGNCLGFLRPSGQRDFWSRVQLEEEAAGICGGAVGGERENRHAFLYRQCGTFLFRPNADAIVRGTGKNGIRTCLRGEHTATQVHWERTIETKWKWEERLKSFVWYLGPFQTLQVYNGQTVAFKTPGLLRCPFVIWTRILPDPSINWKQWPVPAFRCCLAVQTCLERPRVRHKPFLSLATGENTPTVLDFHSINFASGLGNIVAVFVNPKGSYNPSGESSDQDFISVCRKPLFELKARPEDRAFFTILGLDKNSPASPPRLYQVLPFHWILPPVVKDDCRGLSCRSPLGTEDPRFGTAR